MFFFLVSSTRPLHPSTAHNRVAITTVQHSLYCHVDVYSRCSSCWEKENHFVVVAEFDIAFCFILCRCRRCCLCSCPMRNPFRVIFHVFSVHINSNKHRVQHARGYSSCFRETERSSRVVTRQYNNECGDRVSNRTNTHTHARARARELKCQHVVIVCLSTRWTGVQR